MSFKKKIRMLKNYHNKKLDLGGHTFWSKPCLDPTTITSCFIGDLKKM
jgi:hypothetical protein